MSTYNEFDVLTASAAGMEAQRAALDVAARNVAAAEAAGPGDAFQRLVPRFSIDFSTGSLDDAPFPDDLAAGPVRFLGTEVQRGAEVDAITEMVAVLNAQRA